MAAAGERDGHTGVELRDKAECLRLFVPMMQQAQVDYARNPGPVNQGLLRMVKELASSWTLSEGLVADAAKKLVDLGLTGNGPDATLGNLDMDRLTRMIDILEPINAAQKVTTVKPDLAPPDIATNEFIDPSIRL